MKTVLISIQPRWCKLIAGGKKTVEVRKSKPKLETPFKVYIYCTQEKRRFSPWSGKVIAEFVCDAISINFVGYKEGVAGYHDLLNGSCLTGAELMDYGNWKTLYGWHISDLKIYDKPMKLRDFSSVCRYKNDDGTCPTKRVACTYQEADYNQDGSLNIVNCGKRIQRAPQSWCYVEEDYNAEM